MDSCLFLLLLFCIISMDINWYICKGNCKSLDEENSYLNYKVNVNLKKREFQKNIISEWSNCNDSYGEDVRSSQKEEKNEGHIKSSLNFTK